MLCNEDSLMNTNVSDFKAAVVSVPDAERSLRCDEVLL